MKLKVKTTLMVLIWLAIAVGTSADNVSKGVRQAFKGGNPSALQRYLPADGRVHLAISAVGIKSGDYSKSQALALLRKTFSQYRTVSFSMNANAGAIRVEWAVRKNADDKLKSITLYISVKKSKGQTIITSIRGG